MQRDIGVIQSFFSKFQKSFGHWPAVMGDGAGNVSISGKDGWIKARMPDGQPVDVYNGGRIKEINDQEIFVGYTYLNPFILQVLDIRHTYAEALPYSSNGPHAPSHMHLFPSGGDDVVWIDARQWMPLRIGPAGGLSVRVYQTVVWKTSGWEEISDTIDLTSHVPVTGARYVLIAFDTSGNPQVTDGSTVAQFADLTAADIPAVPAGQSASAAVGLYAGQTEIVETQDEQSFVDLRYSFAPLGSASYIWTKSGTSVYLTTATDNVGIGTSSPSSKLHVVNEFSVPGSGNISGTYDSFGDQTRFGMRSANGTIASPTQLVATNVIGNFNFRGWHSDGAFHTFGSAGISGIATESYTPTAGGGALVVTTTPNGATASAFALWISSEKNVGIGITSNTNFGTGAVRVLALALGTGPSTSITDGVQMWEADRGSSAGKGSLHLRTEDGTQHVFGDRTGIGTLTPSNFLSIAGLTDTTASVSIGGTTFATSLAKGLQLVGSTAPTGIITDGVIMYEGDRDGTAGKGSLFVMPESNDTRHILGDGQTLGGYYAANATGFQFFTRKSRNATVGSHTIVQADDILGRFGAQGSDGAAFITAGYIEFASDGTPGTNDMPGRFSVYVTADGASTPTERLRVTQDGRLFGSALHNNAGAVTGTTNQYIASGTYTPSLTNVTNVAASTAYACQWLRVGNVVVVSGKVDIDATLAASAATELGVSLPIASNFTAEQNLGGTATSDSIASLTARIKADATNDRASLVFKSISLTNDSYAFIFSYVVL